MQEYETTFVIDSLIKNEEVEHIIDKTEKFILNNGGEIINIDRWGKKRLAYELKKRQYGYYVQIHYKAPGHLNKILEREYMLDENILRYLTVMISSRTQKSTLVKKSEAKQPEDDVFDQDTEYEELDDFEESQLSDTPDPNSELNTPETSATEEIKKEE